MNNKAYLSFLSQSSNVSLARMAVTTFASELGFTLSELEEIKVAISEAVTNSIIHGYPENQGIVDIEMELEDNSLHVIISDYGQGIDDIEEVKKPAYSTKDEHMGLGLAFIDSFMDQTVIDSQPGEGTVIKMMKTPETMKKAVD